MRRTAAAVLLGTMMIVGCGKERVERTFTPVTVKPAERYSVNEAARYSANVQPYTTVNLAFKASGYVTAIMQVRGADGRMRNVQDGDSVKRGMLLARLRQTEFLDKLAEAKARLAEADAEVEKAKLDFDRANALFSTQSLTKPDFDSAKSRRDVAQAKRESASAAVRDAEINLGDSSLYAPQNGVLLQRSIEVGTLITPSTPAFVMADASSVKVVFGVPDVTLRSTKLGQTLAVSSEALGTSEIRGRVTRVSAEADSKTRLFEVELTIPNPHGQLKPGMIAALSVPEARPPETVVVVPLTAVLRPKHDPTAFALYVVDERGNEQIARLRKVQVGAIHGDLIAVTDGVRPGERVISTGTMLLSDGDRVRLVPEVVPE